MSCNKNVFIRIHLCLLHKIIFRGKQILYFVSRTLGRNRLVMPVFLARPVERDFDWLFMGGVSRGMPRNMGHCSFAEVSKVIFSCANISTYEECLCCFDLRGLILLNTSYVP